MPAVMWSWLQLNLRTPSVDDSHNEDMYRMVLMLVCDYMEYLRWGVIHSDHNIMSVDLTTVLATNSQHA